MPIARLQLETKFEATGHVERYSGIACCWELTPEELEEVIRTKKVWVLVMGDTTYPLSVTGHTPFPPTTVAPDCKVEVGTAKKAD